MGANGRRETGGDVGDTHGTGCERGRLGGGGQTEVKRQAARARAERRVPESMYVRIHGEEESWRGGLSEAQWDGHAALHGDTGRHETQAAVRAMWGVFLKHAGEVHGKGRVAAETLNGEERAKAAVLRGSRRPSEPHDEAWRTLYLGGEEERPEDAVNAAAIRALGGEAGDGKKRRRAGLERAEGDDEQRTVTVEEARRRVDLGRRMWSAVRAGSRDYDLTEVLLPEMWAFEDMCWDPEERRTDGGKGIWKGELGEEGEAAAMHDPLARVLDRVHAAVQEGWRTTMPDGTEADLDENERAVLASRVSAAEDVKVMQPAVALHIVTRFTDVWATDGSRKEVCREDGTTEVAVGAGAYGGRQPAVRGAHETIADWRTRQVGMGMRCARLPGHYEVIDAELAAMLMALTEVARRPLVDLCATWPEPKDSRPTRRLPARPT